MTGRERMEIFEAVVALLSASMGKWDLFTFSSGCDNIKRVFCFSSLGVIDSPFSLQLILSSARWDNAQDMLWWRC